MPLPEPLRLSLAVEDLDGQVAGLRNIVTGEIAPLDDPTALADWLIAARDWHSAITVGERLARQTVLDAMDRDASWTLNRPTGSLRAPSPTAGSDAKDSWDGNALWIALSQLVKDGTISEAARDAAVKTKVEYAAVSKGVKALLKLPGVAPYVEACRKPPEEPKPRSVTVK